MRATALRTHQRAGSFKALKFQVTFSTAAEAKTFCNRARSVWSAKRVLESRSEGGARKTS